LFCKDGFQFFFEWKSICFHVVRWVYVKNLFKTIST
jgi:hypothetical protein